MPKDDKAPSIRANVSGNISGQVAIGSGNTQVQQSNVPPDAVTAEDLATLRQLIADLRKEVGREAPPEKQAAAMERLTELEDAVTGDEPELTTMEYVTSWFGKNLPAVAGSVTSLVVHPIVGKLVGAAGDALVSEFQRRFGAKQ